MGILNVTPDSFSDGGRHGEGAAAVEAGVTLHGEGADWVDVGGESTRPGAAEVDEAEELRRVLPVVQGLVRAGVPVSVDTRRASVAERALDAGAGMINDVRGGADPGMFPLVARQGCAYVLMHTRGTPATMAEHTAYGDVVAEVWAALDAALGSAVQEGVRAENVWLDPGIGFAKTPAQSLELLRRLPRRPRVLVGASRKRFLGELVDEPDPARRVEGSLAVAAWCLRAGVGLLRVHDVRATRRLLTTWAALEPGLGAAGTAA